MCHKSLCSYTGVGKVTYETIVIVFEIKNSISTFHILNVRYQTWGFLTFCCMYIRLVSFLFTKILKINTNNTWKIIQFCFSEFCVCYILLNKHASYTISKHILGTTMLSCIINRIPRSVVVEEENMSLQNITNIRLFVY